MFKKEIWRDTNGCTWEKNLFPELRFGNGAVAECKAQLMECLSGGGQRSQQVSFPLHKAASYPSEKSQNHVVGKDLGVYQALPSEQ